MKIHTLAALLAGSIFVSACAGPGASYRPIVAGPYDNAYEIDLVECQGHAYERDQNGDERRSGMLAGAFIGALLGLFNHHSHAEDVVDNAFAGAVLGGLDADEHVQEDRQEIVMACMDRRGYIVLG